MLNLKINTIMGFLNKVLSISAVLLGTAVIYKMSNSKRQLRFENLPNQSNVSADNNYSTQSNRYEESTESDDRVQKMFKDLEMTENQKERYNRSIKSVLSDWKLNNPNVDIDSKSLYAEEDKSLKAVLNEVQYGMYRDWTEKYMN
ncbi:hypothetical protein [Psychroserpens sp. Hel_I_66]|uniref:hypothetical protein n=1 Tax=Psychroserpens sp. Hel_I_66 TaxID=1250004 RepID=UPI0006474E28|nr:hypothetical protein [Psychroserpens sp. Hel_I_66]